VFYQVSLHLAEGFQRRRLKYEKLTDDDGHQVMAKAHIAFVQLVEQRVMFAWNVIKHGPE
jgi:hypothetical protein